MAITIRPAAGPLIVSSELLRKVVTTPPMTAVNKYRMPFILPAAAAARRIARVIDQGRRYAVVPWQMALVARAMKLLPNAVYDRLFKRAGRKPRGLKL